MRRPGFLYACAVTLLVLASLATVAGRFGWPFEVFTHFKLHYSIAGLVLAVAGILMRQWRFAGLAAVVCSWSFFGVVSVPYVSPSPEKTDGPSLTIAWANVFDRPEAAGRALSWAESNAADLVVMAEFPEIDPGSLPSKRDYPYRLDTGSPKPRTLGSRIVAFSRLPIRGAEVLPQTGAHDRPTVRFGVEPAPGQAVTILATHPDMPATPAMLKDRNTMIRRLSPLARAPFIVTGDFNTTPWSPDYADIPGERIGSPVLGPTWLTSIPLLGLPIDHIKISPGLSASRYKVSPFVGSDHRAILARIELGESAP